MIGGLSQSFVSAYRCTLIVDNHTIHFLYSCPFQLAQFNLLFDIAQLMHSSDLYL